MFLCKCQWVTLQLFCNWFDVTGFCRCDEAMRSFSASDESSLVAGLLSIFMFVLLSGKCPIILKTELKRVLFENWGDEWIRGRKWAARIWYVNFVVNFCIYNRTSEYRQKCPLLPDYLDSCCSPYSKDRQDRQRLYGLQCYHRRWQKNLYKSFCVLFVRILIMKVFESVNGIFFFQWWQPEKMIKKSKCVLHRISSK